MKEKITILLMILLGTIVAHSQVKVSGKVNNVQGAPIPYATVEFSKDGKSFGKIADSLGTYLLNLNDTGIYSVKVTSLGFKDSTLGCSITQAVETKDFLLTSDETKALDGVVVASNRKPLISRKADRYIMNVDQSALAKGRNTFEILNYAPGVMTLGNNIAINGNTSTKIMVNGKLLRLSSDQVQNYLANLQADEVESIEIIPVPGAEFEAEGGGGIISIKLKNKKTEGLTGALTLGARTPKWPSYNTSEQLNYQNGKLQLYGSHSFSKRNSFGDFGDKRNFQSEEYITTSKGDYDNYSHNYRIGMGYDIAEKDFWGIEFNGNNNGSTSTTKSQASYNNATNEESYDLATVVTGKNKNSLYTWSTNYVHQFDSIGSNLKILADYTRARYGQNSNYDSKYTDADGVLFRDSIYRNRVPLKFDNYDISADYLKKLKGKSELRLGAKYTRTKTINDVRYEYLLNDEYVNDIERSNVFDYTEKIAALYLQYNKDWERNSLQLGLRGENTDTKGISTTTGTQFKKHYFNFFPSLFFKHEINNKNALSFSYSRRLGRPSYSILNPFELRVDDYTYVQGNPSLNPQYTHSFELAYLFNNKYELTLFSQLTKDPFGQPVSNNNSGIVTEYLWQNMNHNYNYGINAYIPVKITKWWNTINNLLIYYNIIKWNEENNRKTIFQAKTTQQFSIGKTFNVELSGYYQSKYIIGNLLYVPNYSVDIGISKSLFNNKLNVRLLGSDIFNTDKMDYKSVNSNIMVNSKQKYLTRRFSIQFTYNFKSGKKISVKKVEGGNQSEKDRM